MVTTTWVSQRKPSTERWTERTIDQSGGESGVLGRAAFSAEKRAGDLPDGVHPLLDVNGEGEEIDPLADGFVGGGGGQHLGFIETGNHCAVGKTGKFAGGKREVFPAYGTVTVISGTRCSFFA